MELHVHEWGDSGSPPVVCLHGVNAHGRRFRRLAEDRLAARFHVLSPDLRGHGYSDWDPPWSIARALLLDPAIQLLPHVSYDFAERERADLWFESPEEAIQARLDSGSVAPREFLEEEMADHLVEGRDGRWRFRYCQAAVVALYGELCTPPPEPET